MNNKLVFIIILLLIVVIWIILFKISANNIEKFDIPDFIMDRINKNQILYPPIDNYTINPITDIDELNNLQNNFKNIVINIYENFTVPNNNKDNSALNGYGLYYIYSSFKTNNNSNLISNLFKPNNNIPINLDNSKISTFLLNDNTSISGNYIIFQYSFNFQFTKILININSNDNLSSYVSLYQSDGMLNTFTPMANITFTQTNNILTGIINDAPIVVNTILILINNNNIKNINLKNINIYGIPINIDVYNDKPINSNDINFQGNAISLIDNEPIYIDTNNGEQISNISIEDKFKNLISIKPPWGMYNCSTININNTNKLKDVFNRECRYAIINNKYDIISNETTYYNNQPVNVQYLKGDQNTQIIFPPGSLPSKYTICVISRYTSSNHIKCGRILTGTDTTNPNWLLGHWGNNIKVMYNRTFADKEGKVVKNGNGFCSPLGFRGNTNWIVSCCKTNASNVKNCILYNGEPSALQKCDIVVNTDASLCINACNYGEQSDFGLAYLIIWNRILEDDELKIASDMLIKYLTGEVDFKLNISLYLKDGSTPDRAGFSAKDIKQRTCTNIDGVYWINVPTGYDNKGIPLGYIPKQIYCIMNDECNGGGWMLAIKGASNTGTFAYNSSHWTTNTVVNDGSYNMDDTDAKFSIFNTYKYKECLAIFNSNDVLGLSSFNKPELLKYGWIWQSTSNFSNLSLLEFFSNGYEDYKFSTIGNIDSIVPLTSSIENKNENTKISAIKINKTDFENNTLNLYYPKHVWSRQDAYRAFGFNISSKIGRGWGLHRVRWGATFNENGDGLPTSNDVSGGIGLEHCPWNAGDCLGCCESTRGSRKQMGFKWFIR